MEGCGCKNGGPTKIEGGVELLIKPLQLLLRRLGYVPCILIKLHPLK